MGASCISPDIVARTNVLAMEIGETFKRARVKAGHTLKDVALAFGLSYRSQSHIIHFEHGNISGIGLMVIIRNLERYGYTLKIVPIDDTRDQLK